MGVHQPMPSRERTARRRAALRAQGLRPRQFWLPDVHDEAFKLEARRAAKVIAASDQTDVMAFVDAVQYWPED